MARANGHPAYFFVQGSVPRDVEQPYRIYYRIRYIFPTLNDQAGTPWAIWQYRRTPNWRSPGATTPQTDSQAVTEWLRYGTGAITDRFRVAGPGVYATNQVTDARYRTTLELNYRGLWPYAAVPTLPGNRLDREPPGASGLTYRR